MKNGYLDRHIDVSGKSGTGRVAELAISSDGRVAVFWPDPNPSVASFPDLDTVRRVHGHEGKTTIVILNDEVENVPHCDMCHKILAEFLGAYALSCNEHGGNGGLCPGCLAGV